VQRRKEQIEAETIAAWNDPGQRKRREWIKEVFKSDLEQICNFAATLMQHEGSLAKENEELQAKLNRINSIVHGLSAATKIPAYIKHNIAALNLQYDPTDPASLAFVSGMNVQKSLQASRNAIKSHSENHAARAQVFAWCDVYMTHYPSMNKAAEAVAQHLVPYPYPTVRGWMTQWKRERDMAASAMDVALGRKKVREHGT